jgi:hypothetical protein
MMTNMNNNIFKSSNRERSSPKINQYNNENIDTKPSTITTYKTNQKFSDFYPILAPPVAPLVNQMNTNVNINLARSNSCISISTKSANSLQRVQPKLPVKASNIRDTQWIKDNILRNLQTRKPLAAAASVLNSNTANSASTTDSMTTTTSYYLQTPAASTLKAPSNDSATYTPPSTMKLNPSSIYRQNGQQRSSDGVKKVEFVNLNENTSSNMNSFQRLCELASRWNNKNRLVATEVIKLREKKYLSNSTNSLTDKIKIKQSKKVSNELEEVDFNSRRGYSKLISKIQLRPVNENVSFTNIHYAFSGGPKTPPLHIPPLQITPTNKNSINNAPSNSTTKNDRYKSLIGIQQPLHVT